MCGIVGIWNNKSGAVVKHQMINEMCRKIAHRGPDAEGIYVSENIGLGHRRLSILDTSHGKQPWSNKKSGVHVVFNGEIYNYQALRKEFELDGVVFQTSCDTEVIPYCYLKYGEGFAKHLNGMFSIGIWDEERRKLLLARDRLGKKPLLYAETNNGLIFSSEMQSLLCTLEIDTSLSFRAIDSFLAFGYIPNSTSIFQGVKKLAPASVLIVSESGKHTIKNYWKLRHSINTTISKYEAKEELELLIRDSVKKRLASDVPIGAFLSGGIDSSLISAIMASESQKQIKTYCVGFSEAEYDERSAASYMAEYLNTDHHEYLVEIDSLNVLPKLQTHFGEPFGDPSAIPTYYLCKAVSKDIKVAISGDGGDELFLGYNSYRRLWYREMLQYVTKIRPLRTFLQDNAYRGKRMLNTKYQRMYNTVVESSLPIHERFGRLRCPYTINERNGIYSDDMINAIDNKNDAIELIEKLFCEYNELNTISAAGMVDQKLYLPDDIMVKVDIASMANSLEVRSPLLDYRIAEFTASLPQNMKYKLGMGKLLLKEVAKKYLPESILKRPKQGFGVPVSQWLRNSDVKASLLDSNDIFYSIFRRDSIEQLLKEHTEGSKDNGNRLWLLLCFSVWLDEYSSYTN